LMQEASDRQIHLYPIDPQFRECVNILPVVKVNGLDIKPIGKVLEKSKFRSTFQY